MICTIQLYNLYRNTPLVTRSSCLSGPPTLNDIHQIFTLKNFGGKNEYNEGMLTLALVRGDPRLPHTPGTKP